MTYKEVYQLRKTSSDLTDAIADAGSRIGDIFLMRGAPYKNTLDYSTIKPDQKVYVGIGGCFAGAQDAFSKKGNPGEWIQHCVPGSKVVKFRHNDSQQVQEAIDKIKKAKGKPVVYAHSWGTQLANDLSNKNKDLQTVLIDPVSWRFDPAQANTKVYYAKNKWIPTFGNIAAFLGNRVSQDKFNPAHIKEYQGGHDELGKAMDMQFKDR